MLYAGLREELNHTPCRFDTFTVSETAWHQPLFCPAAVAIHNDANVTGNLCLKL
jgi:hypothetical protein